MNDPYLKSIFDTLHAAAKEKGINISERSLEEELTPKDINPDNLYTAFENS